MIKIKRFIKDLKQDWKAQPITFICSFAMFIMVVATIFICCTNVYNRNKKIDAAIEQIKEADNAKRMYKNQTFLGLLQCLCIINQEGQKGWKNPEELEAAVHFYNHLIDEGYDLKDIKIESPYVQKDTNTGKLTINK